MIVKNESKIIERCLSSAQPVIDTISIVDTGSTDDTITVIETWAEKNHIPCRIHQEPFQDFGYNRTHSYTQARESFPETDYFLLLDADMVLEVPPHFSKSSLTAPGYMLLQYSDSIEYWNIRLLGNDSRVEGWRCQGVTHEYWESVPDHIPERFMDLKIDDKEDGGCKADKYERDKRLLLAGYEDPQTPEALKTRYLYYLGQTCECLQQWDEAIEWFRKRSEAKNSWEEEAAYAIYRLAGCYESQGETEKSIYEYLRAFERRPARIESLYKIVCHFRQQGMNEVALMYACWAKAVPYPESESLFIEFDIYEYKLDLEIAIVAYYVPHKKNLGRQASKRLKEKLQQKKIPLRATDHVRETIGFYGL
jgi:glycosyltransferase involved in cell wall biosynthesis